MSAPLLGPSHAQITMMGHNISARIVAARARRRRQIRLTIAAGAVTVGVALSAAGIGVATAPPAVQETVFSCFPVDNPGSTVASISALDGLAHEGADRVHAALEACTYLYGFNGVQSPDPTACELPDLRLGVFPNLEKVDDEEFCRSLGLGLPPRG